jgi:DNA modification methylase
MRLPPKDGVAVIHNTWSTHDGAAKILIGDCLEVLKTLEDGSVNCCVTSPPYWGMRDYGVDGQLGLEPTPDEFVAKMVDVFREVRRVLRDDGTLWLNLGDSYAGGNRGGQGDASTIGQGSRQQNESTVGGGAVLGLKPKDLVGIPWRVAFALQADGWWLRQDIIWHKPNPMPESVRDRCTKAHEYIFLLSKSRKYYYDAEAIAEPFQTDPKERYEERARICGRGNQGAAAARGNDRDNSGGFPAPSTGRNRRSVWTVTTKPYPEAHFATYPPKLIEPCILAGCPEDGMVLDPFGGSGTTAAVALKHGRRATIIELNPGYGQLAIERITRAIESQALFLKAMGWM